MRRRRAIVRVSLEALAVKLGLPPDTKITAIECDAEYSGMLKLVVDGPGCPLVRDGEAIPWVEINAL
jgi:hypothetical protein